MNQTRKHSFERMNKRSLKAQGKTYKMLQAQQSQQRKKKQNQDSLNPTETLVSKLECNQW